MANLRVYDPILTSHAKGYKNGEMAAEQLFPTIFVDQYGGQILEYDDSHFETYDDIRQPGAHVARMPPPTYSGKEFTLGLHDLEAQVPVEHAVDAERVPSVNLQRNAVTRAQTGMELGRERQAAVMATTAGNYPGGHTVALAGTAQFDDAASSPFSTFKQAKSVIRQAVGVYPNVAIVPPLVFEALQDNPEIRENYKYTTGMSITLEMVAQFLQIPRIVIGSAIWKDPADGVRKDIWAKNIVVAYSNQGMRGNDLESAEPSYGYTYTMRGHPVVEPGYLERSRKTWFYPVSHHRTPVISCNEAGYLIQTAVS